MLISNFIIFSPPHYSTIPSGNHTFVFYVCESIFCFVNKFTYMIF